MMSVFTPNAADIISDIERMIDVVRSLASFQGLAQELPGVEKALQFASHVLRFAQKLASRLPISPEQ